MLQDALGIAFCLYMLKTVRLPTFKVTDLNHNAIFFFFERFLTVFDCFNKSLIINCFLLLPDAGLHFTNDRPVRL